MAALPPIRAARAPTSLTFSYTVSAASASVPTLAIVSVNLPNGATINQTGGGAANLSGALVVFSGLGVDPPVNTAAITAVTETPSSSVLGVGQTVTFTLTASSALMVAGERRR